MGVERPPPSPSDQRPRRLARSSWITLAASTALALAAIVLFPRSGGDAPPLASLALMGTVIAAVTTTALYAIVRRDLRLPQRLATSLAIAFVLIALVKFVLAPLGLYEVNAVRALDDVAGTVGDPTGATITAAVVLGLYAFVYWLVFRLGRSHNVSIRRGRPAPARPSTERSSWLLVVFILGGLLLALSGIGLIALLFLTAPRQYLEFVFSSGAGVIVAAALAVAATLIHYAFRSLGRRPNVAELGTVVTLFWLGLGFLALYHVLWIVYVLVLGSIWPLRTVVPK